MKTVLALSAAVLLVLGSITPSNARQHNNRFNQRSELERVSPTVHGGCAIRTYGEQGLGWSLPPTLDCEYAPRGLYVRRGSF